MGGYDGIHARVTDNLKYSKTVWMQSMRSSATGANATPTILIFSNIIPTGKRFLPDQLACWRYEKKNLLKGLEIKTEWARWTGRIILM